MGIVTWVWYNGIPRAKPEDSIIPHEGYKINPCTLENHSTADLYYDAATQTTNAVFTMQLGCIVSYTLDF